VPGISHSKVGERTEGEPGKLAGTAQECSVVSQTQAGRGRNEQGPPNHIFPDDILTTAMLCLLLDVLHFP
jgi:hypothetical protein